MDKDLICVRVKEFADNGQEKEYVYGLTYEDYAIIRPILNRSQREEAPIANAQNPTELANALSFMFGAQPKKGIIYNMNERPKEYTIEEIMDIYQKRNFLLIASDKTETKSIF